MGSCYREAMRVTMTSPRRWPAMPSGHLASILVGVLLVLVVFAQLCDGACYWSNEGCRENKDCCSNYCFRAHEGTNPRCARSSLNERCIFDYHCSNGLKCGTKLVCCSPYWQSCINNTNCCEEEHVCRYEEGFIYKRCIYPAASSAVAPLGSWTFTVVVLGFSAVVAGLLERQSYPEDCGHCSKRLRDNL